MALEGNSQNEIVSEILLTGGRKTCCHNKLRVTAVLCLKDTNV